MCGIAGIANVNRIARISERDANAMLSLLRHRGPDGCGVYRDENIVLGHSRLSIIDLEGGSQPIHNETSSIWVSFNGEVFNFVELRQTLESTGHIFSTCTDTEVIVHAYEEYGFDFVQHLNGQFCIAIWDCASQRLVLVRDRVGILPLFYIHLNGRLIFASEVKALLTMFESAPELDVVALDQLFTFWAPVSPKTFFKDVKEVPPGHMLVLENGELTENIYWDWKFPETGDYLTGSDSNLAEQLYELLGDATRIRLRSDVPVASYLSGGLDSSALVALVTQHSNSKLKTFSISFEDKELDESDYQQQLVTHLGVDHHQTLCTNADIGRDFYNTIWFTEMPMLRTAPVPMRRLSALVREHGYKVVLTGEGADEVLGGYDIFKEAKIRAFWARQPGSVWRSNLLKRLYPWLDSSGRQGLAYLRNFYGIGIDQTQNPFFGHLTRWYTTSQCKQFFSPDLRASLSTSVEDVLFASLPTEIKRWHPFNRTQYIEVKTLMAGYLLSVQGDRMLMANSVEGRFPFLDHRVIEFANNLSPQLKMRVLNEKYLLKLAMAKYLPKSILCRHKQPYRAPDIPAFFDGSTPEYVKELLSENKIISYGYFDSQKVQLLVKKAEQGRSISYKDNMALVGILSTQIWHHVFIDCFNQFKQYRC